MVPFLNQAVSFTVFHNPACSWSSTSWHRSSDYRMQICRFNASLSSFQNYPTLTSKTEFSQQLLNVYIQRQTEWNHLNLKRN